jgi:hypothetical protein
MKKINGLFIAIAVVAILTGSSQGTMAQTTPGHIYHINTWYMVTGMDSAQRADRDAILREYFTKVTMKNEFVLHQWNMVHFFSEDSREFEIVTEYATWADIEKGFDRDAELEKQAWPDAKKRADFMKKMDSYFTSHKDGVYHGISNMTK